MTRNLVELDRRDIACRSFAKIRTIRPLAFLIDVAGKHAPCFQTLTSTRFFHCESEPANAAEQVNKIDLHGGCVAGHSAKGEPKTRVRLPLIDSSGKSADKVDRPGRGWDATANLSTLDHPRSRRRATPSASRIPSAPHVSGSGTAVSVEKLRIRPVTVPSPKSAEAAVVLIRNPNPPL